MTDPVRYDRALADVFGGATSDGCDPTAGRCPDFPGCQEERYVRDLAASLKAGEAVGQWKPQRCAACEALAKNTNPEGEPR